MFLVISAMVSFLDGGSLRWHTGMFGISYISISQQPIAQFQWNMVWRCAFWLENGRVSSFNILWLLQTPYG